MDREELHEALNRGPVAVTMNDGSRYVIPSLEMAVVSDLSASVLYKSDDGKWRTHILSLVAMVRIEELETTTE